VKQAAVLLFLALSAPLVAQQGDRARTEALATRAAGRLQALHQEADRLATEARTLIGDLRRLELERQIRDEELRQSTADADGVASELAALNQELRRLEEEDQAERPGLEARLVELYKLGRGRYVRLLLSTADAQHIGQAARLIATLARQDRDRVAAHEKRLQMLRQSRAGLEERSARLVALREEAERAQAAAARAVAARNAMLRQLDERRDVNAQLAGELQLTQQKLQATLRTLGDPGGATGREPAALPLAPFRGDLDWPVPGAVRRRFGGSAPAASGQQSGSFNGIEIAASEGAPARAVHGGTVAFADTFAGYGNLVILDHGAQAFSLYGQLLDLAVARGARVEQGQAVGSVGASLTGTPGLYFELRIDGRPVDPLQWLKKR
jgi:septal ring factor EnvC (AmiA/AmiB activator)